MANLTTHMVCWDEGGHRVTIIQYPDEIGLSDSFDCSFGACDSEIQTAKFSKRKLAAFVEAVHLIVRDGCDPIAVHKAFSLLEEYRHGLAADMPIIGGAF